jgi:transcription factor C subunit 6
MAMPGPFSTYMGSVSAAGDLTLTDLRNPDQDRLSISRAMVPNRDLVYSPFTHSFISAVERAGNTDVDANSAIYIVCQHIRQLHTSLRIAKLPSQGGAATAVAGSRWHPCILAGNAGGTIVATNYLRKILPYRREIARKTTGAYLQTICEYDWRAVPDGAAVGSKTRDIYHGNDAREGLSQFREGFKPEKIEVGTASSKTKRSRKGDTGMSEVTFEEEQAVTAIDWNPNPGTAGLAAIGWGSGIVRIQDLAHDME